MTEKAGIEIDRVLVADASNKTTRINAYFTGIGSTKRIVIYDNLLKNHSEDETLSVISHEIGHWKYRHILWSILFGSAGVILISYFLSIFLSTAGLGNSVRLVIVLFILFSLISYLSMPLQNLISRQFEKQADSTAIELTGDKESQIEIFQNIAVTNLSNVSPGSLLKNIIYSHPPIMERLIAIEKMPQQEN